MRNTIRDSIRAKRAKKRKRYKVILSVCVYLQYQQHLYDRRRNSGSGSRQRLIQFQVKGDDVPKVEESQLTH